MYYNFYISRCPVGGCGNDKPIIESDLIKDKVLKKYIEKKNRHAVKRDKKL